MKILSSIGKGVSTPALDSLPQAKNSDLTLSARVTQTLSAAQNASGGFGGGHGQISHCAPSYAAVLSLAMIGGTKSLELIDRKALYVTSPEEDNVGS